MYDQLAFGRDVFMKTEHPTAVDSKDDWSPEDQSELYHGMPLSFMCDFYTGERFAKELFKEFGKSKNKLLDLGTATGSVPLTMRKVGMHALGLDGLDVGKRKKITSDMLPLKHPSNEGEGPCSDRFAWNVAPEIVECCDITQPFRIEDRSGKVVLFDYIYSADCFEHLVTERVSTLVDNVYEHLAPDGYGIFEVNIGAFAHIHQTVQPLGWWKDQFARRFIIDEEKSARDYLYTRSKREGGELRYFHNEEVDGYKILFWVKK